MKGFSAINKRLVGKMDIVVFHRNSIFNWT